MTPFLRPRAVVFALIFALAGALPFFTTAGAKRNRFFFEISVSASIAGNARIFWNSGRGFREKDSAALPFTPAAQPTLLRFDLPPGSYRGFRFEPIDRDVAVTLTDARIVNKDGAVLRRFAPEDVRPLQPTQRALAPCWEIELDAPLRLRAKLSSLILASAGIFLGVFAAFLALCALPGKRLAAPSLKLWRAAQAHPRRALAALSLLIVAIHCHPVLFFGKSFVSPDHGGALLYDRFPVLPGHHTTGIENIHGSDVGALMFWHLYSPVIAHDALFRDRELPLWNRYSLSGVPLLGQGQSMFGDPLNWLSILSRSAAWSWDARFVLARWLLCCGLGLTVWTLTRHLPAALLVATGAGFLGFFGFRLNHPANFSLCYAPWILLAWAELCRADTSRIAVRRCLLLVAANFCVITSGTVKEAYLLVACLNLAGLFLLLGHERPWRQRLRWLAVAGGSGVALALLTAPLWLSFLSTLQRSTTLYDHPAAAQTSPALMIGFFDDLFYRQLRPDESVYLPAMNFLFLLGALWAVASLRELVRHRAFVALGLAALVPFAMVFGFVPASAITQIPFLANVVHIDNTLSCPLIILTAVLAGFGFEIFFRDLGRPTWKKRAALVVALLGGLGGLYAAFSQSFTPSAFFIGYAWSMIIALLALAAGLRFARKKSDASLFAATLLVGIVLLTWRHSQYLRTPFDDYVFNPKARADLHPASPVVDFIETQRREPSRPIGFGLNLFPGYHQMLGWESILGVDALRNRDYEELAVSLGLERVRTADTPLAEGERVAGILPGLNLFNVRYYLARPSVPARSIPGLTLLGSFDLDVSESPGVWPRAFFTNRLWRYATPGPDAFARQVKNGDQQPFAAASVTEHPLPADAAALSADLSGRAVRPARAYRLTANTTSFEVDATSAGVVVLSETYYPDEFRLTVNGRPHPYFRANHAFKGVYVAAPGTYRLTFSYWPQNMTLSLILSALGALLLGWAFWWSTRPSSNR